MIPAVGSQISGETEVEVTAPLEVVAVVVAVEKGMQIECAAFQTQKAASAKQAASVSFWQEKGSQ